MHDILSYRLDVNGTSFYDVFYEGDITHRYNTLSYASITIPNPEGIHNNSLLFTPTSEIKIFVSRDGGSNYHPLFAGTIRNVRGEMAPSGQRIMKLNAQGGSYFSGMYVSPNQVSYNSCDIGHLFVGTITDWNGVAWSPDDKGNYPNGMLYKTGYTYKAGSVWSLFGEEIAYTIPRPEPQLDPPDLPQRFTFNMTKLLDVFTYLAETFALMFFFDHVNMEFACYKDSYLTEFPSSDYEVRYAENLNRNSFIRSDEDVMDNILIVGSSDNIFYIKGDGRLEGVVIDEEGRDVDSVINIAEMYYNIHKDIKNSGEALVVPVTENILGKRVNIIGGDVYVENTVNIVGVEHRLREDRWDTLIGLDSDRRTVPKLLSEIIDDIDRKDKVRESGQIFLKCFAETGVIV